MLKNPDGFKKLSLGVMLACSMSAATATTLLPANDLFLNAYESYQGTSYNIDLGVSQTTFLSEAGGSFTLPTSDSAFFSWLNNALSNGGTITYNIASENQINPKNTTQDGLLSSYEPDNFAPLSAAQNLFQMTQLEGTFINRVDSINQDVGLGLVPSSTFDQDLSGFNAITWGPGSGSVSVNTSTTLGNGGMNELVMQYEHTTGIASPKNSTPMTLEQLSGYFSINAATNAVTWTVPAAVPVPGAAWLFSGGLLALLNLQKRKANPMV